MAFSGSGWPGGTHADAYGEQSDAISGSSHILALRIMWDRWKQKPWKEHVAYLFKKKKGWSRKSKVSEV